MKLTVEPEKHCLRGQRNILVIQKKDFASSSILVSLAYADALKDFFRLANYEMTACNCKQVCPPMDPGFCFFYIKCMRKYSFVILAVIELESCSLVLSVSHSVYAGI